MEIDSLQSRIGVESYCRTPGRKNTMEGVYRELYKGVDNSHDYKEKEPQSEDDIGPHFLKDEVLAAIGEIKNNKAEEIDNIPIEMLR